ncbi:hypothetical protein Tco_0285286 [Tanacetum coccineum]
MFERENLSGSNYNDWFRSPKMVLRVEKKLFVIEQPVSPAPLVDSKYLRSGMRFMMLIMRFLELKFMFEKQAGAERFDLIQTFHACKHDEGKSVSSYVLKMKGYVEQLERLVRVAGVLRLRSVEAGDHAVCMDNGDKAFLRSSPKPNLTLSCNVSPSRALVKKYMISEFADVLGISISISIFKLSCNETVSNKEKIDLKKSHHRFFPVDTSLILVESHKSPTKSLFDVGSSRISIFIVKNHRFTRMFWQYHKDNAHGISLDRRVYNIFGAGADAPVQYQLTRMMKSLASFLSFSDQSSLHALIVIQASSVSLIISVSVDNGSPRLRGQISPHDSYHQVSDPHVDCRVKASLSVLGEMVVLS